MPHSYTLLLFKQPKIFTVPSIFHVFLPLNISDPLNRVNFPVVDFAKETGLGNPIAANYFEEGSANVTTLPLVTLSATSASVLSLATQDVK